MPEKRWTPSIFYIDRSVENHPRVSEILRRNADVPTQMVDDVKQFANDRFAAPHAFTEGKKAILLTRHKGKFLSMCPGLTDSAVCCNYRTINLIMGCNFDCSYCFLQAYLNNPIITFYVNLEDMFNELTALLNHHPDRPFRFGTGEFTDSLSMDSVLGVNEKLIDFFSRAANAILELKTKSIKVDTLLNLDHKGRTIIAWSVNTDFIQKHEEHKTATVEERIIAAGRCSKAGYRVGFHFDPLIIHEGWREGYARTVQLLKRYIPQESIAWISYGSLRFVPDLKLAAQTRFPATPIFSDEFIKGFDGKMRYFTPLRTNLYQTVHGFIAEAFPKITPYLCMEPEHLWEKSFGRQAPSTESLTQQLDMEVRVEVVN